MDTLVNTNHASTFDFHPEKHLDLIERYFKHEADHVRRLNQTMLDAMGQLSAVFLDQNKEGKFRDYLYPFFAVMAGPMIDNAPAYYSVNVTKAQVGPDFCEKASKVLNHAVEMKEKFEPRVKQLVESAAMPAILTGMDLQKEEY